MIKPNDDLPGPKRASSSEWLKGNPNAVPIPGFMFSCDLPDVSQQFLDQVIKDLDLPREKQD